MTFSEWIRCVPYAIYCFVFAIVCILAICAAMEIVRFVAVWTWDKIIDARDELNRRLNELERRMRDDD